MQDLLSTKEAAKLINVSPNTLTQWRVRKLFGVPFFTADEMHGDTWYYYRERVEQLKSVYKKGILQNMYKLAEAFDSLPPPDFQKPITTLGLPEGGVTTGSAATLSPDFQKPITTLGLPEGVPYQIQTGFYSAASVAKILNIDEKTLRNWRDKKIFVEDCQNHVGISLYNQDRVLEMKLFCQKNADKQANTHMSDLISSENDSVDTLKKMCARIYPSKVRVELNEKLIRVVFKLTEQGISRLLNGETFNVIEKKGYKNHGDIRTSYQILNAAGYNVQRPFTMFDRAVLSVCISEWLAGNRYTTPAIIYRALTGKVATKAVPSKDQLAAILDSVRLLMNRVIIYNAKELCKLLGSDDGQPIIKNDVLLPGWFVEATTVNGNVTTVIFFDRECPLLEIAQAKRQILSYDTYLLNVPNQNNTPMNIELKNYSMIRIQEIITHRMTPVITFNDVFYKCRIEDAPVDKKRDARNTLVKFFDHLRSEGVINSFNLTKKGNTFYSSKITYSSPKNSENKLN